LGENKGEFDIRERFLEIRAEDGLNQTGGKGTV